MQLFVLFLALVSLGIQALIIVAHQSLDRALFGSEVDTLIFLGLGVVEVLTFVLWIAWAKFSIAERVRDEDAAEDRAETGQSSRLPGERGKAFEKMINSLGDRLDVQIEVMRRFAWPFLIVLLFFAWIAVLLVECGLS